MQQEAERLAAEEEERLRLEEEARLAAEPTVPVSDQDTGAAGAENAVVVSAPTAEPQAERAGLLEGLSEPVNINGENQRSRLFVLMGAAGALLAAIVLAALRRARR